MFVTQNLPAASILFWLNVGQGQSLQNRFIFVCLFPQEQRGHKKMYKINVFLIYWLICFCLSINVDPKFLLC